MMRYIQRNNKNQCRVFLRNYGGQRTPNAKELEGVGTIVDPEFYIQTMYRSKTKANKEAFS